MYSVQQPHKTTVRDNEISELAATIESFISGANIGKVIGIVHSPFQCEGYTSFREGEWGGPSGILHESDNTETR